MQGLSLRRQASSDGGRGQGKKRQRTDLSNIAPTPGARAIKKPARGVSASTAPSSEPQATKGTNARKVKGRWELQPVHFTKEAKPAEVECNRTKGLGFGDRSATLLREATTATDWLRATY